MAYTKNNMIIMRAFEVPDLEKEWSEIFGAADKKSLQISEKEVYDEIRAHRAAKEGTIKELTVDWQHWQRAPCLHARPVPLHPSRPATLERAKYSIISIHNRMHGF